MSVRLSKDLWNKYNQILRRIRDDNALEHNLKISS